jgi:hypothetical protein
MTEIWYLFPISYMYPILWEVFLDPSDSYFLFFISQPSNQIGGAIISVLTSSVVDRGFEPWLSQKKHYKQDELWLSWFLCTLNILVYAHFSSHFSQQLLMAEIWYLITRWVQKRFPQYGVPIWSLWPNIRILPSIVAEKNVTKNVHICSMCTKTN